MRDDVYRQVQQEQDSWMKRGRRQLLDQLLQAHGPDRRPAQVLELGAGLGQNIDTLARLGPVDAVEVHPVALETLRTRPGLRRLFTDAMPFDLDAHYDVICALEVIEHLPDDRGVLRWARDLLTPGGVLVLTVPACPWLFSEHDEALGHLRRYTRRSLLAALPPDLRVLTCGYTNLLLFPAQVAQVVANGAARRFRPPGPPTKRAVPHAGPLDAVLGRVFQQELALLRRGLSLPYGGGLYCVARRD